MINKIVQSLTEAIAGIRDGAVVLIGGFGSIGQPNALIEAWEADRWGNLTYKSSARNFNPVMATAAALTIAQAQHIVPLGELDPERIHTPGIYVNRIVHVPYGEPTVT